MRNSIHSLTIIGCGQVGTSIIAALRSQGKNLPIHVYDTAPDIRERLEKRLRDLGLSTDNLIFHDSAEDSVNESDLVIMATPIDKFGPTVKAIAPFMKDGAILTDTGSAKKMAIADIQSALPPDRRIRFVGAHPGNGSKGSGPETGGPGNILGPNSWMFLIRGDTNTPVIPGSAEEVLREFWDDAGVQTATIDADTHDRFFGACSHLQHLIVFAMMSLADGGDPDFQAACLVAGTGLRNLTRVADTTPEMWLPILRQNKEAVLSAYDGFLRGMSDIYGAVARNDRNGLISILAQARDFRRTVKDGERRESIKGEIADLEKFAGHTLSCEFNCKAGAFESANVVLPYVIAAAQSLNARDINADLVREKANPSFRDGTAMALNDPEQMATLLLHHRYHTADVLGGFARRLHLFVMAVRNDDEHFLRHEIDQARKFRVQMPPPRRTGGEPVRSEYAFT